MLSLDTYVQGKTPPSNSSISEVDYEKIAAADSREVLPPGVAIQKLTEILPLDANESYRDFQQLVGEFLIFLMPMMDEVNEKSKQYSDEGYDCQGSRMAFYRPKAIMADFKKVLATPDQNAFLILKNGDKIVGTISLLLCDNGLPELSNFYLNKQHRGQGVGKYLLSCMLSFAKDQGHKEVFLTSRGRGFEKALNLFRHFGFEEVTKPEELSRLVRPEYQSSRTVAMIKKL